MRRMLKTKILIFPCHRIRLHLTFSLTLLLCLLNGFTYSQRIPKNENLFSLKHHAIGIQLNPYLGNSVSFQPATKRYMVLGTLRYTYQASLKTALGAELSGTHLQAGENMFYRTVGLGIFGRYWFWQNSWLRTGIEGNAFTTKRFYQVDTNLPSEQLALYHESWKKSYHFTYFVSPVVSLRKNQSPWSFDLMYKFTTKQVPNYLDKSVFSYRINYHF